MIYADEHKHGFNVRPAPLDRALDAARRAVQAAPSNHFALHVLAQALFFRREFEDFRLAAERAIALNPMDGDTVAFFRGRSTFGIASSSFRASAQMPSPFGDGQAVNGPGRPGVPERRVSAPRNGTRKPLVTARFPATC